MLNIHEKLVKAAEKGDLAQVKQAIENGADIHFYEDVALKWAAVYGHLDVVKYLVEQGADIHEGKDYALGWAAENGRLAVVKYLLRVYRGELK